MTKRTAKDVRGLEYDWLGVDAEGHVALFTTAGGGFCPAEFLVDTDAHDRGITALEAVPPCTPVRFFPDLAPGLKNSWEAAAERGVFAFDSDPNGGPYRMVARPVRPVLVSDLPEATREAARRIRLQTVRFLAHREGSFLHIEVQARGDPNGASS